MRKIEEAVGLFWSHNTQRKFYNTEIVIQNNITKMFLHRNLIAIKLRDDIEKADYIGLSTRGWNTITTKSRLNCIDVKGLNFYIKNGQIKVNVKHKTYNVPSDGYLVFKYENGEYKEIGVLDKFHIKKDDNEDIDIFRFAYRQ